MYVGIVIIYASVFVSLDSPQMHTIPETNNIEEGNGMGWVNVFNPPLVRMNKQTLSM